MLNCDKARVKLLLKLKKRIILRSDRKKNIQHVTVHVRSHDWEEPIQCESNVSVSSQVDWTLMQTRGELDFAGGLSTNNSTTTITTTSITNPKYLCRKGPEF